MNDITQCELTHLDLLLLTGPDAIKFLQGQCTQDVSNLSPGQPIHGAFCNAKGRAITNVWFMKFEAPLTTIGILCHASSATALHKHLSKYLAFFRGTTLTHTPQRYRGFGLFADGKTMASAESNLASNHSLGHWSDNRSMLWIDTAAPDSKEALSFATSHEPTDLTQWQSADIQQKRLWLNEKQVERWIPQNFSLDELDGISFTKGCYTGQEVVARLHYKGQSKKRLFAFITKSSVSVELKFENIYEDSGSIGDVIESCRFEGKTYGLAILKVDKTELPLFADENQQFEIQLLH